MISKPLEALSDQQVASLIDDIRSICNAEWLLPVDELEMVTSTSFGCNVHTHIQHIKDSHRPLGLKLHNKTSAVVIDSEAYEVLARLKAKYAELLTQVEQNDILKDCNRLEDLFARVLAPQTAARFKSLHLAKPEDLAATYKPG